MVHPDPDDDHPWLRRSFLLALLVGSASVLLGRNQLARAAGVPSVADDDPTRLACQLGAAGRERRHVVVGDVHGSAAGLKQILHAAGFIAAHGDGPGGVGDGSCVWQRDPGAEPSVLVQVGDIVDRGPDAPEAWRCLEELQRTSPNGTGSVVRLAGNHELMWLEAQFKYALEDSQDSVTRLTRAIHAAIVARRVRGAHVAFGGQLLITHAGLRPAMRELLLVDEPAAQQVNGTTGEKIAHAINELLLQGVSACEPGAFPVRSRPNRPPRGDGGESIRTAPLRCALRHEVFSGGRERGGSGIGGPFWTDLKVLHQPGSGALVRDVVQVVGHSASPCDAGDKGCEPIRQSIDAGVIDVDIAMLWGNRGFLEITPEGGLRGHTLMPDGGVDGLPGEDHVPAFVPGTWQQRDLKASVCD